MVTFDVVPSPLTVAVEQGTATFQCQHPLASAVSIGWLLNRTPLNRARLTNVSTSIQSQGLQCCNLHSQLELSLTIVKQELSV